MLSFIYILSLLAAGSIAGPCKPRSAPESGSATPNGGATPGSGAATPNGGATPGSGAATPNGGATPQVKAAKQRVTSNNTVSQQGGLALPLPYSLTGPAPAGPTGGSGGGSCPPGFMNTVFNTNAGKNGGWPETTWNSLSSNGINDWIGFAIGTLDKTETYGNCKTMPALNDAQIHVVMDGRDVEEGLKMVQSENPPAYLEFYNEPDFSFMGFTPLTDPIPAAQELAKFFSVPHPKTQYISPALMDANGPWLKTFFANCNNCLDQIPIIGLHVYNPEVQGVMDQITTLHATYPDKKIWITELSPATKDCSMDMAKMTTYMQDLISQMAATGYVEKVFWNSGEWDAPAINGAPEACNPALTDASGNPTPVLEALGKICGGGGTATS